MARFRSWLRRLYARDGFRGPVVTLLSGTAVSLGISYLAVPVLTRIFTPAEFGVSDYFVMIVSVLITFASLRYEDAMMLPENDGQAADVFWLAAVLTVGTSIAVGVAAFWSSEIAALLRVPDVAPWLWLLAPTLLLMRFSKLAEVWLSRRKAFRTITGGELANKLAMLSTRLSTGLATQLGAGGLIGGYAAGQAASSLFYGAVLARTPQSLANRPISPTRMRSAAARYRRFPLFSMPASLLNAVVARLPILLLPVFFGMDVVGLFGRAFTALAVPLSLIGTAVSQVFFVHAAEAHRAGRLTDLSETVHTRLVMIGVFPTMLLVVAGPELFAFVFGAEWRAAGTYEQMLAGWFFLSAVASPLTRLFDVLERQRTELAISILMSLALTAALVLGGRSGDVFITMALAAAAGGIVRLLHIAAMLKLAGLPIRRAVRPYLRYISIGVPLVFPVWLVRDVWPLWATAGTAALMGAAYLALVVWREELYRIDAHPEAT